MRGPFELIRHANDHLHDAGDTDRRMALIGFDNAIEVCIDAFIRLHPRLRDGYEIPRKQAAAVARTYHTKIEFLDKYIQDKGYSVDLPVEEIVWFHQLRNELYHHGNGLVPELHILHASRDAALRVFQTLFGVDICKIIGASRPKEIRDGSSTYSFTANSEMEFLRVFIDFEGALSAFVDANYGYPEDQPRRVPHLWKYASEHDPVTNFPNDLIDSASDLRNRIVHGHGAEIDVELLLKVIIELLQLTAIYEDRT